MAFQIGEHDLAVKLPDGESAGATAVLFKCCKKEKQKKESVN